MPVLWLVLGLGAAAAAYVGWARASTPRFRYGEILQVPNRPWASRDDAVTYAQELGLASDEHRIIGLHAGTRSETFAIEITRGRA